MTARYLLLRCNRPGHPDKEWAIGVINDRVVVRFGNAGGVFQNREVFSGRSPEEEALERKHAMLTRGYEIVGTCEFNHVNRVCAVQPLDSPWLPQNKTAAPSPALPTSLRSAPGAPLREERLVSVEVTAFSWKPLHQAHLRLSEELQGLFDIFWVARNGTPGALKIGRYCNTYPSYAGGMVADSHMLSSRHGIESVLYYAGLAHLSGGSVKVNLIEHATRVPVDRNLLQHPELLSRFGAEQGMVKQALIAIGIFNKRVGLRNIVSSVPDFSFL